MAYGFSSGVLNGINAGRHPDDAHFSCRSTARSTRNRFHRLTFNVYYEGPFSLGAEPGGGMVARLIWQTAGAPGVAGQRRHRRVPGLEQRHDRPGDDPAGRDHRRRTRRSASGGPASRSPACGSIRTRTAAQRRFLVDNIKIAEDATGYGGAYDIKFHDNAWRAGTTADIYTTPTRGGFGGTRIATGIPVNQGVNTFHWAPNPVPNGQQWVYVVLHRGANTARAYADGPLRMTTSPSPLYGVNPFGSLDAVTAKVGNAAIRGWAIDPNTANPIDVHVYVDGKPFQVLTADDNRPDIGTRYPGYGADHGYTAT